MKLLQNLAIAALGFTCTPILGQIYSSGGHMIHETVIHSTPTYSVPSPAPALNPLSVCNCGGGHTPGTCDCKHLDCKITLPPCKTSGPVVKTPVHVDILGSIPKVNVESECLKLLFDFEYPADVPQIECTIEKCTEIGKKSITCVPGCSFSVCVPLNDCTKQTVECKLVKRVMKMQLWQRVDATHGTVYDVYVINDTNPNSPLHAGGMPAKWLIVHCATPDQIRARFPDAKKPDGTPIVNNAGAKVSPQSTSADVDIKLVIDEELLKAELEKTQQEKPSQEAKASVEKAKPESEKVSAVQSPKPKAGSSVPAQVTGA